jgi:hypothetical protein
VMDGLDTYIDDYGKPDPLPESMLKELQFAKDYIFKDPTKPSPEAEQAAQQPTAIQIAEATELSGQPADTPLEREEMSQLERNDKQKIDPSPSE